MNLYQIDIKYACFGIIEENNVIVKTAPIANWSLNKDINYVLSYFKRKGAIIKKINENK